MSHHSSPDGAVPVFAFPPSLEFYTVDRSSHKQILTIYNPYEFTLKFKVYSTCPDKYNVMEPEGAVRSHSCMDVVVRHLAVTRQHENKVDKFRIKIFKSGDKKVIGHRDINARLSHNKRDQPPDEADDRFQQLAGVPQQQSAADLRLRGASAAGSTGPQTSTTDSTRQNNKAVDRPRGPDLLIVTIALVCLTVLVMPCYGEESSWIPDHIRIAQSHKLIAAFVLGMVTTVILKT